MKEYIEANKGKITEHGVKFRNRNPTYKERLLQRISPTQEIREIK
jgi:hypothetical protein